MLLAMPAAAADAYNYKVIYRGVFSMGTDLPIADVVLHSAVGVAGAGLVETRLEASSGRYPNVETLHPFRYRFRSWSAPDIGPGAVAFERYQKTKDEKHVVYLNASAATAPARRLALDDPADQALLAVLERGQLPPDAQLPGSWDRLGLLQHVRGLELEEGRRYALDVTTGKRRFRYQVLVEAAQSLAIDGQAVLAWKVRFDGERLKADGGRKPAHRPLYVWFSRDAERVPLRVDARHAIGRFRIELANLDGLARLASAESPR
jgi:hypothetical protein